MPGLALAKKKKKATSFKRQVLAPLMCLFVALNVLQKKYEKKLLFEVLISHKRGKEAE